MTRYIDVENAISVLEILADKCVNDKAFEQVISVLKDVPTADVVEVVRCKDCQHYGDDHFCCYPWCTAPEEFCSRGKRREDGD